MTYDPEKIQQEYQAKWRQERVYEPDLTNAKRPYYNLMMFPYPSAEGLHVGNMYAFTGADVHGRFRRMLGHDVFEPIGLDGFGIHSENYALKVGRHPAEQAEISEENFYRQLTMIGNGFAWESRLETYDPEYYRWTQWLFIQMFRNGLAYKGVALVNWCPSCKTVLADEQVEDGKCERCKSEVERREMSSWYFKITEYADRLLENIDNYRWTDAEGKDHVGLDWPSKVTLAQKNWIGRKDGLEVEFAIKGSEKKIAIWTTASETIFGVSFLVLAPESSLIAELTTPENKSAVAEYVQVSLNKSEQERQINRDKTGVFTGSYAINPANGQEIPIWVADYVLTSVGTGAVMGVAAHDQRDFEFAQKFSLDRPQVIRFDDNEINQQLDTSAQAHDKAPGVLMNSGKFDGMEVHAGKQAIDSWLIEQGVARHQEHYHLRDWLISRQRYWGPPIPMVYCEACAQAGKGEQASMPGWYAVTDDALPVVLPHLDDYKPKGDGSSPLDNAPDDWKFTACPSCGTQAKRETDVSDTFLDSSWYFLRYPAVTMSEGKEHPFPQVQSGKTPWFPVDAYIGGAEHAVLHLLYARFVTMALKDWGMLPSEEPFPFLFGHGLIIKDGAKMSKSKGNVVNPDDYITKYGADALRAYLMFLGPYDQGGDFRDTGMNGMYKWLNKVWEAMHGSEPAQSTDPDLTSTLHRTIEANTKDMRQFKFNTCLARLMEFMNAWKESGAGVAVAERVTFLKLLAPFAPYATEALFQELVERHPDQLGAEQGFRSLHRERWPEADAQYLVQTKVTIAVQVNGKLRGTLEVSAEQQADKLVLEAEARRVPTVAKFLEDKTVRQVIVVPGKVVSFVV